VKPRDERLVVGDGLCNHGLLKGGKNRVHLGLRTTLQARPGGGRGDSNKSATTTSSLLQKDVGGVKRKGKFFRVVSRSMSGRSRGKQL